MSSLLWKGVGVLGAVLAIGIFLESLEPGFLRTLWSSLKSLHRN